MADLKWLVIHETETKLKYRLTADVLELMHRGLFFNKELNYYKFDGKKYLNYNDLEGVSLKTSTGKFYEAIETNGRGWSKVGYSKVIFQNGTQHNYVQIDSDQWIESKEITNGAFGFNSKSVHMVLEGGYGSKRSDSFEKHFSDIQDLVLYKEITEFIAIHPQIKVIGHNQISKKECPGFWIPTWMAKRGLEKYTINANLV